ncbi:MAG: class II aldolase/adducin family protein [Bdellovibrionales bacterium]|nr:class II aldolase/adducin family protein [Bdellovibrionales bacterium]
MNDASAKSKIIEICRRLHTKNWLAACDGNVSIRTNEQTIFMTPSARHKGYISESDLAQITPTNQVISGSPSGERLMHLAIYQQCAQARAVVHAHPPAATAWSIAQPHLKELPAKCISEVILAVGALPIVPYARPGTQAMGDVLIPYLPHHRVMILGRHGAVAWGEDIEEAYNGIERLEHSAQTLMYAHMLGGLTELPESEVEYLQGLRRAGNGRTL